MVFLLFVRFFVYFRNRTYISVKYSLSIDFLMFPLIFVSNFNFVTVFKVRVTAIREVYSHFLIISISIFICNSHIVRICIIYYPNYMVFLLFVRFIIYFRNNSHQCKIQFAHRFFDVSMIFVSNFNFVTFFKVRVTTIWEVYSHFLTISISIFICNSHIIRVCIIYYTNYSIFFYFCMFVDLIRFCNQLAASARVIALLGDQLFQSSVPLEISVCIKIFAYLSPQCPFKSSNVVDYF